MARLAGLPPPLLTGSQEASARLKSLGNPDNFLANESI